MTRPFRQASGLIQAFRQGQACFVRLLSNNFNKLTASQPFCRFPVLCPFFCQPFFFFCFAFFAMLGFGPGPAGPGHPDLSFANSISAFALALGLSSFGLGLALPSASSLSGASAQASTSPFHRPSTSPGPGLEQGLTTLLLLRRLSSFIASGCHRQGLQAFLAPAFIVIITSRRLSSGRRQTVAAFRPSGSDFQAFTVRLPSSASSGLRRQACLQATSSEGYNRARPGQATPSPCLHLPGCPGHGAATALADFRQHHFPPACPSGLATLALTGGRAPGPPAGHFTGFAGPASTSLRHWIIFRVGSGVRRPLGQAVHLARARVIITVIVTAAYT